jgi:FlaA1/EpsC-like NDP-sugar epimerase
MVERAENALFDIATELQANPGPARVTAALADIKHIPRMSELFQHFKPDVIFHAAAYKHVPILESHPTEAVLNNVIGTVRLAELARTHGTEKFVFISTDKAVKPSNLMGSSKRICEMYLIALNARLKAQQGKGEAWPDFRVVRFGNVLGSAGSALPLFQHQIENGAPITITDPEVSRFFMTVREAVALVLESASMEIAGDITVLDMGEPVKIAKLADDLVAALGLPPSAVTKRVVGLRPGEKMHESLWEEVDEVQRCAHPRVMAVRQRVPDFDALQKTVVNLERMAIAGEVDELVALVRQVVPTYGPDEPAARAQSVQAARETPTLTIRPHAVANGAVDLPSAPMAARSPAP